MPQYLDEIIEQVKEDIPAYMEIDEMDFEEAVTASIDTIREFNDKYLMEFIESDPNILDALSDDEFERLKEISGYPDHFEEDSVVQVGMWVWKQPEDISEDRGVRNAIIESIIATVRHRLEKDKNFPYMRIALNRKYGWA